MKKGALTIYFLLFSYLLFSQSFDFTADTTEGCSPLKVVFLNTTTDSVKTDYTYEWTVESGKYSTQIDSVQNTYINPGEYTITMKVYDKTKKLVSTITKQKYIRVFPDPDVIIKSDKPFTCENKAFQFSIDSVISDTTIVSYTWILSDGSSYLTEVPPPHTFGFKGEFEIFLSITDAHGCSNRERKTISVSTFNDYPSIGFTTDKSRVCEPTTAIKFTNTSTAENATEYKWDFGDGSGIFTGKNPPVHTYNGYGTYYAILSTASVSGCESSVRRGIQLIDYKAEIQITDKFPPVEFDPENYDSYMEMDSLSTCPCKLNKNYGDNFKVITDDNKACIGTITFTDLTPSKDNITWQWDLNADGTIESSAPSFSYDFTKSGTYTVKLTTSNGACLDETIRTFTIEEPLDITIEPTEGFYCSVPAVVDYSATSNIPGTEFLWRFGYSNYLYLGDTYQIKYTNQGHYNDKVYAISPNYCRYSKTISKDIEISLPEITNNLTSPTSGCVPLDVSFSNSYTYDTKQDSLKSMTMFYGDNLNSSTTTPFATRSTSGSEDFNFTYTETGVFYPMAVIETYKGCTDTLKYSIEKSVKVGQVPNISINYDKDTLCANESLGIITTFNDNPTRYSSEFDTLTVTYIAENGKPTSRILSPIPSLGNMQIQDTIGVHSSTYYVSDNGCSMFVNDHHPVVINGPIIVVESSKIDCSNPTIFTFNLSKALGITNSNWYVENITEGTGEELIASNVNSILVDFNHYGGRGKYKVKVIAKNTDCDCEMTGELTLQITKIIADFGLVYDTYCLNSPIDFDVNSTMGQDIANWTWLYNWNNIKKQATFATKSESSISRFDKSKTVTYIDECGKEITEVIAPDPSYLYFVDTTNITSVTVVATDINGCNDTITKPIKIAIPNAEFVGDILSDCLPFTTTFSDTSKSESIIAKREWKVDNTTISDANEKSITIPFNTEGFKTITLKVTDEFGCSDEAQKVNYVKPIVPNSKITALFPNVCLGFETEFVRNTLCCPQLASNLSHYKWDFGDGTKEEKTGNPNDTTTHLYANPTLGTKKYDAKFIAYATSPEGNECVDTSLVSIDVKAADAKIVIKNSDKCKEPGQKFIIYLDNTIYTSSITSFNWWKIDNGDSIYVSNRPNLQVVTFNNYGDQKLFLQTKSKYHGCENMITSIPIHVPGYEVAIMADKNEACIREDITFSLFDTLNLYRYNAYWEFGDGQHADMNGLTTVHDYNALAATDDNTYKIQFIVDAAGCKPRDISTNVTIFPVIADFTRGLTDTDTIGCAPYSVTLYNTSVAGKDASYLWYLPDGTTSTEKNPQIAVPEVDSVYPISLTVTSNVCNDSISKNVTAYPTANIAIEIDSVICYGETIHAKATGDYTSLQWQPAELFSSPKSSTTDITVKNSQYVYATTTSIHDCNDTDSIYVYVQQKPRYQGAPDSLLLYYGTDGLLHNITKATNEVIAGQIYNVNATKMPGVSYTWSPSTYLSCSNCSSPDLDLSCGQISYDDCLLFPEFMNYTITMADSLGCFTSDTTIHFNIIMDCKISMPEAFTPNGDGKNDFAFVRGWGIKEFINVTIYNRWGQIVFETNDINQGWDGTFQGKPQGIDTFSYTIKAKNLKGEDILEKGHITLIR